MKDKFTSEEIFDLIKDSDVYRDFYYRQSDGKVYQLAIIRMNTGDVYVWACENRIKPQSTYFAHYDFLTRTWTQRNNKFVKIIDY